jgi:glycosyltransferase involved in cell wall biosynthesis
MNNVTLVVTSYNRIDLLKRTIESFNRVNTYPVNVIIIDDSGNEQIHRSIRATYPEYKLILNEKNIGLVESIDKAYAEVTTPYIFHSEDDFQYTRSGFIEESLKLMESEPTIFRVGIRGQTHIDSLDSQVYLSGGVKYKLAKFYSWDIEAHGNQFWHGFGFQCGMIRKCHYDLVKPYTQYSTPDEFITIRECRIGLAYYDLKLSAVSLIEDYAIHTGGKRSTYGLRMDG